MAVTLALAFATTRMLKENNLVRVLRACETMGNATVICSDKTGTLTQNQMTVVAAFFGSDTHFSHLPGVVGDQLLPKTVLDVLKRFQPDFTDLLTKSIALNSTAFEEEGNNGTEFVGSKTEIALLRFAKHCLHMNDLSEERANACIKHVFPFDSAHKCMGIVYRKESSGYRMLVKGAPEVLLDACSRTVTAGSSSEMQVATESILDDSRRNIVESIDAYARMTLRTLALAYRDFQDWPPLEAKQWEKSPPKFEELSYDMTWIGAFGIHDPLREKVPGAIKICHSAGVEVKMVTGQFPLRIAPIAMAS